MAILKLFTLMAFLIISACSFKKGNEEKFPIESRVETSSKEDPLVTVVRSGSKEEVERNLGEKSAKELENIVAINGDSLILVAARRGSIEILELLREKGLSLWSSNRKTGESLITDINIISADVDSALKGYLESSLRKDLDIAKRYFHKGHTAAGMNILSKAQIPCRVFTRSMMFMLWANPHIEVPPFIRELVKTKECLPSKSSAEAQDFLILEFAARLKYGVNNFEVLKILSEEANVKIPKFEASPIVTSQTKELTHAKLVYSALALIYLSDKAEPAGLPISKEEISKAAAEFAQLNEEPELVLQVTIPDENVSMSITYSGIKYQQADLLMFADHVKAEFSHYYAVLFKKYNLQRYSLYPDNERSQ
ncbi:MAG: hypothetical protein OM95_06775 [Bdellovibrio sp. ArHS]|uniref:hypothetical protein n=1 Tax=Bdellovibrio sp. ArHS TaxID=1569284 RepID=UPI0005824745|nr:hypothetical protein [Bdellovibrio sp. ArHS]KHD88819.1 MAG: hypothetical protein OM95_06775 [Bdellovibrio sp. ArHS]